MWRLKLFIVGWKRQSATMLDEAGCPIWLIKWRCPESPDWGTWLEEFFKILPHEEDDSEDGR